MSHNESFPRFDRVIRSQRLAMHLQRFVSLVFVAGTLATAASLSGCAGETDQDLQNRDYVTDTVDSWGTPLPAQTDDGPLSSLHAEILAVMPDATFELVDADAFEGTVTATIVVRGTLRLEYMGIPAGDEPVTLRFEVITVHDGRGRIIDLRRRLAPTGRGYSEHMTMRSNAASSGIPFRS